MLRSCVLACSLTVSIATLVGCTRDRATEPPAEWLRLSPVVEASASERREQDPEDLFMSTATIDPGAALEPTSSCATGALPSGVQLTASATRLDISLDQTLDGDSDLTGLVAARWWVDGRPVHARGFAGIDSAGTLSWSSRHLRIELRDAMAAIQAAPGAHVGVQLLICPAGLLGPEAVSNHIEMVPTHPRDLRPRISPRVDFVVPPASAP
jgi:hypothetical protein